MILDGKTVAESFKEKIQKVVKKRKNLGENPTLAVVQLCEEEGLEIYLKTRQRIGEKLGINVECFSISKPTFSKVEKLVKKLNKDPNIWGIMIDRPIPKTLDEDNVINLIAPNKDVEGCTWENGGKLLFYANTVTAPTAMAALEILKYYNIPLAGKKAVVVGRSKTVGAPLFQLLQKENATCTLCHSKTVDLEKETSQADILIIAIGQKQFITEKYLNRHCTLIDIGTHYDEMGKICGDVERSAYEKVENYAPSPGGVGPVTNIMLFINLLRLRGLI